MKTHWSSYMEDESESTSSSSSENYRDPQDSLRYRYASLENIYYSNGPNNANIGPEDRVLVD